MWPAEGAGTKGKKTAEPVVLGRPLMFPCSVFNSSLKDKKGKRLQFQLNERPSPILKIMTIWTLSFPKEMLLDVKWKKKKKSTAIIVCDFRIPLLSVYKSPNRNQQRNFIKWTNHRHPKCNLSNTRETDVFSETYGTFSKIFHAISKSQNAKN